MTRLHWIPNFLWSLISSPIFLPFSTFFPSSPVSPESECRGKSNIQYRYVIGDGASSRQPPPQFANLGLLVATVRDWGWWQRSGIWLERSSLWDDGLKTRWGRESGEEFNLKPNNQFTISPLSHLYPLATLSLTSPLHRRK